MGVALFLQIHKNLDPRNISTICISYISGLTLSLNSSTYSIAESDGFVKVCVLGLRGTESASATATISTQAISATGLFFYCNNNCLL